MGVHIDGTPGRFSDLSQENITKIEIYFIKY